MREAHKVSWRWHPVIPLCWSKHVTQLGQIQGVWNGLHFFMGVAIELHGRVCGSRKEKRVMAIFVMYHSPYLVI